MRKIVKFLGGTFIVLFAVASIAAVTKHYATSGPHQAMIFRTETITADASGDSFPVQFKGGVLYSVEMKCTDDDIVTYTLYSHNGSTMYTRATTSAIAGDYVLVDSYLPVNGQMTYDISGYGDGTGCTFEVTQWAR